MAQDAFKKSCSGNCSCSGNNNKQDSKKGWLRLEFSKAADYDRANIFFDPTIKSQIDPYNYVAKRVETDFRYAIDNGNAAFLSDDNNDVQTLVMNYHVNEGGPAVPGQQHEFTELGTTISRLQGYHSATLVAAALALKEWWAHPPQHLLMTEIKHSNIPPQKIYKMLGWEPVTDPDLVDRLIVLTYKTVPDETGAGLIPVPTGTEKDDIGFYSFVDKAIAEQAKAVLKFMDKGGIYNAKTNHFIPVDFSDLDRVGLTRKRLEAMAQGETARDKLRQIPAP